MATPCSPSSDLCLESCAGRRPSFLDDLRLDNFTSRAGGHLRCYSASVAYANSRCKDLLDCTHKKPVTLFHHILGYFSNSGILATKYGSP